MRYPFVFLFCLIVCACSDDDKKAPSAEKQTEEHNDAGCIPKDTITVAGNFVKYTKVNDHYVINWGNKEVSRQAPDGYSCSVDEQGQVSEWMPQLDFETKTHLGLRQVLNASGAYNPIPMEYSIMLLPLNNHDPIVRIQNYLQSIDDYIVSTDLASTILIHHIPSGNSQEVELYPSPAMPGQFAAKIRSIRIKNEKVWISWEAYDHENDKTFIKKESWDLLN